jgi:hypothetical protein
MQNTQMGQTRKMQREHKQGIDNGTRETSSGASGSDGLSWN